MPGLQDKLLFASAICSPVLVFLGVLWWVGFFT